MACVFHTVRCDNKYRVLGHIFPACILVNVSDVMYRSAERINQCRTAPDCIVLVGHRLDFFKLHPVVQNLRHIVEKHGRNKTFTVLSALFLDHGIKAADRVALKSCH